MNAVSDNLRAQLVTAKATPDRSGPGIVSEPEIRAAIARVSTPAHPVTAAEIREAFSGLSDNLGSLDRYLGALHADVPRTAATSSSDAPAIVAHPGRFLTHDQNIDSRGHSTVVLGSESHSARVEIRFEQPSARHGHPDTVRVNIAALPSEPNDVGTPDPLTRREAFDLAVRNAFGNIPNSDARTLAAVYARNPALANARREFERTGDAATFDFNPRNVS